MIKAVIIAGGSGTRLWPLSRSSYPKQFMNLNGKETMLQSTIKRLEALDISSSLIVCNEEHRFFVAEQLREIDALDSILLEPVSKNTAPAIALAALVSEKDSMLLILPADHVIQDNVAFTSSINKAIPLAESGKLVTFGIVPNKVHTGYGYIKIGCNDGSGFTVDGFEEKPSQDVAQNYIDSGSYLWNSGIFLFNASRYLEELEKFRPDIYAACVKSANEQVSDLDFLRINKKLFSECPSESIDIAIMEKTDKAVVVPMDAGWSDIGSWRSLWDVSEKDKNGNAIHGDVITHKTKECYIRSDSRLVVTVGLENLFVVDTKDVLMVANKDSDQYVKDITKQIKDKKRSELDLHREVHRPWGKYDSIDNGNGYQVKRITVNPGAKLSLQKHRFRAEHWVVVSGTARVINGDKVILLTKNESTYIPIGAVHSLENPGDDKLELIEVQSGSYLGEDDIIRIDDIYGREIC